MADKKSQREKFEEAARELGIDESDGVFEAAIGKIAKSPKLTDEEIKALAKRQRAANSKRAR